ncbi:MAG: hypothetical protein AAGF92_03635 [Myxococcota bacterium]
MLEALGNGILIDFAIALLALEMIALLAWRARATGGMRPLDVVGQLLAGGVLLIALRASVAGASIWVLYALLALSLPAHAFDLIRRLRHTE